MRGKRHDRIDYRLVLMPQEEGLFELRGLDVATPAEFAELSVEVIYRRLQIGERLTRVGTGFETVTQSVELLRHRCRVGLQNARRLQRCDVRAHLGREPEACDQN